MRERLVRVVLERLVAQHARVLLDGLVGVVGAGDQVELGEDLGAIRAVVPELVLGIQLLRQLERLRRCLVLLETRAIDLAEPVEQTDAELVEASALSAAAAA